MARRKRDDDGIWPVAQLIGLFVGLGLIYPPFRQTVVGFGAGFVLLVIIAIGIYKLVSKNGASSHRFTFQTSAPASDASVVLNTPCSSPINHKTTAQIIEQLRSIDWYQVEQLVALVYQKQGYKVRKRGGANPDAALT